MSRLKDLPIGFSCVAEEAQSSRPTADEKNVDDYLLRLCASLVGLH
jgi:hypothetical protein